MPDPGEPGAAFPLRSNPVSTLPTPFKPWDGEPLAVPSYISGKPVLSAIRVPTCKGEVAHVWAAILFDPVQEKLIVCEIRFEGGWKMRVGDCDITDYGDAYEQMIARAGVLTAMRRAGFRQPAT